jgi:cytochrome c oxidase assembly protein subunit 15
MAVVCYALLMVTGGAVRLTGSGLGCPDWPSCYHHRLTAQLSFNPMVEFLNRLVTVLVTVVSGVAFVAALLRSPSRRDLLWLAGGLVGGVAGQIVLGGIVVLTKLNPYLVACHFLLTIAVLADAIVFYHRAGLGDSAQEQQSVQLVGPELKWLGRILVGVLGIVTAIGTVVTGSGPHAGAPETAGAPIRRIPIAFRDIAVLHSDAALFLIGITLASLFAFHVAKAPPKVERRIRWLFELMVLQGALGYTQYFLHDAAGVVEIHIAGATMLWVAGVGFLLSMHGHPERPALADSAATSGFALVGGPPEDAVTSVEADTKDRVGSAVVARTREVGEPRETVVTK